LRRFEKTWWWRWNASSTVHANGRGWLQGVVRDKDGQVVAACPHHHADLESAQGCAASLIRQAVRR
jgi:hypothetical protein